MKDVIFREYDIRGIVGKELLIDDMYELGRTIAYYLHQHNPSLKTVAVGMDGRTHSSAIKEELCRALIDSGLDVHFVGVCPTPALYFALHTTNVDGGIMITASHNAKEYNGLKICLGTHSIWGAALQELKKLFREKKQLHATHHGTVIDAPIIPSYLLWLVDHFSHLKKMNVSLVIDCGNGAAGTVIPQLIKKMEWRSITLLYPEVDGTYPNHEADPTVEKNMADVKQLVQTTNAQLGIGFDGDGDRMTPMTKKGFLVPGDQLLALFAHPIVQTHPHVGIVFDIKSSEGLVELLKRWGARPIMSPSGHSIIKEMMEKHDALLGGELSCHFFFKDRYFGYDDGIYAALRLLEILHQTDKSLQELLTIFPKRFSSKELRLHCPEEKKQKIIQTLKKELESYPDSSLITIDGIRVSFPFGWAIIRASNTQAALSMRFESTSRQGLKKVLTLFEKLLAPYLAHTDLDELAHAKEMI